MALVFFLRRNKRIPNGFDHPLMDQLSINLGTKCPTKSIIINNRNPDTADDLIRP